MALTQPTERIRRTATDWRRYANELEAELEAQRSLVAVYRDGLTQIRQATAEIPTKPTGVTRERLIALLARCSEALRHDGNFNADKVYRQALANAAIVAAGGAKDPAKAATQIRNEEPK
jgi:hypothetical protein